MAIGTGSTGTRGLYKISVTKALAAASAYDANDVISEHASTGTDWDFTGMARGNGGSGYIVGASVRSESEGVVPQLTLYLFNTAPTTGALNDHAANTSPDPADTGFIGKIDFQALESVGTTDSYNEAVSTCLPKGFICASTSTTLYGILVTRTAFTQSATDDMTVTLVVEQL